MRLCSRGDVLNVLWWTCLCLLSGNLWYVLCLFSLSVCLRWLVREMCRGSVIVLFGRRFTLVMFPCSARGTGDSLASSEGGSGVSVVVDKAVAGV